MSLQYVEALRKVERPLKIVGLMSGTSMDGIDAVLVEITSGVVKVLSYEETPLIKETRATLGEILDVKRQDSPVHVLAKMCQLNAQLGLEFAAAALKVIHKANLEAKDIDMISSHGQTVYHIPVRSGPSNTGSTLQLGDGSVISTTAGIPVVWNFRPADMAVGGLGAPLMPFADAYLFGPGSPLDGKGQTGCILQNIGGIANATVISSAAHVSAFDTGPGNMVMDILMSRFYNQSCDHNGETAQSGQVLPDVLKKALQHSFFSEPPPRATGHEVFGAAFVHDLVTWAGTDAKPADLVRTAAQLTVVTILNAYDEFIFKEHVDIHRVIVSGGGTYNPFLMALLREEGTRRFANIDIRTSDAYGVPSSAKEAIGFAILGAATWNGIPANVLDATGASSPVVLGSIAKPLGRD